MKNLFIMAALAVSSTAFAAEVNLGKTGFGSGTPAQSMGNSGVENAPLVANDADVRHVPQYLPGHPTAATIYPRVIETPCTKMPNGNLECENYRWSPSMGRAEYLFVVPRVVEAPKPVIEKVLVPTVIYKEVPVKKKAE